MKDRLFNSGSAMEIGVAVFSAAVLGALGVLIAGRVMTGARRIRGHGQQPPSAGGVSRERHQNVSTVAAR